MVRLLKLIQILKIGQFILIILADRKITFNDDDDDDLGGVTTPARQPIIEVSSKNSYGLPHFCFVNVCQGCKSYLYHLLSWPA